MFCSTSTVRNCMLKMSHRSEKRKDSDTSDLEDLKYRYYKELREERTKIRACGRHLRCPFCRDNKREYEFLELERHASRIARESRSASFNDKARHLGLLKYLHWYEPTYRKLWQNPDPVKTYSNDWSESQKLNGAPKSNNSASSDTKQSWSAEKRVESETKFVEVKATGRTIEHGQLVRKEGFKVPDVNELDVEPGEIVTASAEFDANAKYTDERTHEKNVERELQQRSLSVTRQSTHKRNDDLFVWPWMAIVANIPNEKKDGKYVGESGRKLREEWINKGFNPVKVHPLWDIRGHSGFAVVDFSNNWEGFNDAMAFEKAFEIDHQGKRDWRLASHKGEKLYGWLAREEDYWTRGLIGKHLQKHGDLKTLAEIQKEDNKKNTALMTNLASELLSKTIKCDEITKRISKTEVSIKKVMVQKEEMVQSYNEEMQQMLKGASDLVGKTLEEHRRSKAELEAWREELKLREKELKKRQSLNDNEKRKLHDQKKMNERAIMEQKKADEKIMKLVEAQKREKEFLLKEVIQLEAQLDQKQALQLQIERMRGELEVWKHMSEGDMEDKQKLQSIESELKDKEEELEDLEDLNQTLIIKERKTNDELQDARKELIKGLIAEKITRASIRVKRMGDLDEKPFIEAAKRKHAGEGWQEKAMELCSSWDDFIRDPSWHPYKIIMDRDTHKEILNEDDEKLKELKAEYGDRLYNAVTTALVEMNEYNPSGRYPVPEFWNYNENRKASLKEVIEFVLKRWKDRKKRPRN